MAVREETTTRLTGYLDRLAAGAGARVWVEGESGMGRSRLVHDLADRARTRGYAVMVGYCDELIRTARLRPLADCLDAARAGAPEPDDLVERITAAAADGPVLLVLEDAHFADPVTLALWDRLGNLVDIAPLLLVATGLPDQPTVPRDDDVRLVLGPVSPAEAAELAAQRLGRPPGPRLRDALGLAGGNPARLRELAATIIGDLSVTSTGEIEVPPGADLAALTRAFVTHRLELLDPADLPSLQTAALLGPRFGRPDLSAVLGIDGAATGRLVTAAVQAGLLVECGPVVHFGHELARQILADQLPPVLRTGLHGHVAETLIRRDGRPEDVIDQLGHLPDPLPAWAIDWLIGADAAAPAGAPGAFARLLKRARTAAVPVQRAEIGVRLVRALFVGGRDDEVIATAPPVLAETPDGPDSAATRVLLLRSYARVGRLEEAAAVARSAMAGAPLVWRARLAGWYAVVLARLGRIRPARATARQALVAARETGDRTALALAERGLAWSVGGPGRLAHLDHGLAVLGEDHESTDLKALLSGDRVRLLAESHPRAAGPALTGALAAAERAGLCHLARVLGQAAQLAYARGLWDEALSYMDDLDAVRPTSARAPSGLRALIAYRRDQREASQARSRTAGTDPTGPPRPSGMDGLRLTEVAALRAEVAGDIGRALAIRAGFLRLPAGERRRGSDAGLSLIRLALAAGDRGLAERAQAALTDIGGPRSTWLGLNARCGQAMLDGDPTALRVVADELQARGWLPQAVFVTEELAAVYAGAGERSPARDWLRAAVAGYRALGADWDIRRCEARLRTGGVRLGVRTAHRRERSGWAALTPAELKVSQLVASGLSNPDIARELIVSRSTVQCHVSSALRKLELHSRIDLARIVRERGP